jgi:hypothetical protein
MVKTIAQTKVHTKRCSRCKEEKPADTDHFQRDRHNHDGLTYACKACRSAVRIARYWRDPEKARRQAGHQYARRRASAAAWERMRGTSA